MQADRHFADVEITLKGKKILKLDKDGPSKVIVGYHITAFDYDKEMIKLYNAAETNEEKHILFSTFVQNDETSFRIQRTAEAYMNLSVEAQKTYLPKIPMTTKKGDVVQIQLVIANPKEVSEEGAQASYNIYELNEEEKPTLIMGEDGYFSPNPLNTVPIYDSNQLVRLLWGMENY